MTLRPIAIFIAVVSLGMLATGLLLNALFQGNRDMKRITDEGKQVHAAGLPDKARHDTGLSA